MRSSRVFSLPFKYYSNDILKIFHANCHCALMYTHRMYHVIPIKVVLSCSIVKSYYLDYIHHSVFYIWLHERFVNEFKTRGINHFSPIKEEYLSLPSRNLSEVVPPDDLRIAKDVVDYLKYIRYLKANSYNKDCKLPVSYVRLAKKVYHDFEVDQRDIERIDFTSGYDYHDDRSWYNN